MPQVILYDLEYTCWEGSLGRGWSEPFEHREIVQIGAIKVELRDGLLEETNVLDIIVKPTINPSLSDYFVELTGVTQQRVDTDGISLADALACFRAFAGPAPLLCSWGPDYAIIDENCALRKLGPPDIATDIVDVRGLFAAAGVPTEAFTSGTVHKCFGLDGIAGSLHNAVFDVRSILAGLQELGTTVDDLRQWL